MATKTNTILKKIACNLHSLLNFGSTNGLHSVSAGAYLAIRMIESRQSVAKKMRFHSTSFKSQGTNTKVSRLTQVQ